MSEYNHDEFVAEHQRQLESARLKKLEDHNLVIEKFKNSAFSKGLTDPIHFDYSLSTGVCAYSKSITSKLLTLTTDKDGLYKCSDLLKIANYDLPGLFLLNDLGLLFSRYFRRGYSLHANWAPDLVFIFSRMMLKDTTKDCYIRLESDLFRIDQSRVEIIELDRWYGPEFKNDISSIPLGCTKLSALLDIDERIVDFYFSQVRSLDVQWSQNGNIKTFQAMEFKSSEATSEYNGDTRHPVRYLHAEYDLSKNHFIHTDGAIQFLTPEEFEARKNSDFRYNHKSSKHQKPDYLKIFKINGIISRDEWIDLVAHFFTGNPLVHEYFTGALPERTAQAIEAIRAKNSHGVPS